MTQNPDLQAVLDAQPEAAFIVDAQGRIEFSTARARTFSPCLAPGRNLLSAAAEPERLRQFIRRCSGSRQRCIGAITLLDPSGNRVRFRAYGHRLGGTLDRPRVFIWCLPPVDERFAFLSRRVDELNAEVRKRRHLQAVLEESLRERELLVREMHHRVKNNVQMLMSMLSLAAAEAPDPAARTTIREISRRIAAVGAMQDALYSSSDMRVVSASALAERLLRPLRSMLPPGMFIVEDIGDLQVRADEGMPVALILTELVTNAIKHGLGRARTGKIHVRFREEDGRRVLSVGNPGQPFSFEGAGRRASGLGLVRGLARQLGGSLSVESSPGLVWVVLRYGQIETEASPHDRALH